MVELNLFDVDGLVKKINSELDEDEGPTHEYVGFCVG